MAVWQSNVLWPAGVCSTAYRDNISTDTHLTRDSAMKVCRALRKVVAEVNQRDFSCMSQRCKIVPGVSCCKDSLTEAIAQAEALLNK